MLLSHFLDNMNSMPEQQVHSDILTVVRLPQFNANEAQAFTQRQMKTF